MQAQAQESQAHFGELSGHEGLHEDAIHDLQPVNVAALELLEAVMFEVAGAALAGKAAGAAVEVEVVVLTHMAVHGCAVQGACYVLADAQAILMDEAVLLARYSTTKPTPLSPIQMDCCSTSSCLRCNVCCYLQL